MSMLVARSCSSIDMFLLFLLSSSFSSKTFFFLDEFVAASLAERANSRCELARQRWPKIQNGSRTSASDAAREVEGGAYGQRGDGDARKLLRHLSEITTKEASKWRGALPRRVHVNPRLWLGVARRPVTTKRNNQKSSFPLSSKTLLWILVYSVKP